jgi:hypothetical protein
MSINEVTCDCCAKIFHGTSKRGYCTNCDKYFYVCNSCAENLAKCRFCNIPLIKKREPISSVRRKVATH